MPTEFGSIPPAIKAVPSVYHTSPVQNCRLSHCGYTTQSRPKPISKARMSMSSRKGKSIARRACDLCRDRKVQCIFDAESSQSCEKCRQCKIPCTFLTERKPRGPPNRRVLAAQKRAQLHASVRSPDSETGHSGNNGPPHLLPLPIGELTVEYFLPQPLFKAVIGDFVDKVYPLLPLIYLPEFRAKLEDRQYDSDPRFYRLCIAICAVTLASIPRQIETYNCAIYYPNPGEAVERAAHIILTCRLSTHMSWQSKPAKEDMIVSILLAMAAHYAGQPNEGWAYMSEATHAFRALELYKQTSYSKLDAVGEQLCKRAFWILYIMQVHDRLSYTTPHTSLSYDPLHTDWDFLLPAELHDEEIPCDQEPSPSLHNRVEGAPPVISGFISLIKIFLSVSEVLLQDFPGRPLVNSLSSGNFGSSRHPRGTYDVSVAGASPMSRRDALFNIVRRLRCMLVELPSHLKFPQRETTLDLSACSIAEPVTLSDQQFAILRVNIHVTSLYFQSTLLDLCLNTAPRPSEPKCPDPVEEQTGSDTARPAAVVHTPTQVELSELRVNLAKELLDILSLSTSKSLEANGLSMIVKIRDIAASLLVPDGEPGPKGDSDEWSQQYVTRFADILARLDYTSKIKQQAGRFDFM